MSRSTDTRNPAFAIMLICEGRKTEPNFFYCLCEDLRKQGVLGCTFKVLPKSSFEKEDEETNADRGDRRRKTRELLEGKSMKEDENVRFPGEQPLNWVKGGLDYLSTYNEVWCIFDKDGHPKQKEAFELVEKSQSEDKNINIAFSSRCIEYYFLLHFEYIYKAFSKSECIEKQYRGRESKTVYFNCMTEQAIPGKACDGSQCINGYARKQGYWKESKSDMSLYPILKERLLYGIKNAIRVNEESFVNDSISVVYERNPFVTAHTLTARLLGYKICETNPLIVKIGGTEIEVFVDHSSLILKNKGDRSYIVKGGSITRCNTLNNSCVSCNESAIFLEPTGIKSVYIENIGENDLILLDFDKDKYILGL